MVTLLRLAACSVPASQFSMVAPHRSQAHSRRSLLHWAHRRLLHPQFAMVVLLRPTACSTPASQFSMVASLRSHRPRLWHGGVPALRTPFGRVLAPPAASRPSTAHFVCSALQPFGPSPFCKHLHPQFAIVDLHLRTVPLLAARCSVAAHCASLRVLATSTLRVSDARKLACSSRCSLGLLRAASPTGRALRAPHKKCQK